MVDAAVAAQSIPPEWFWDDRFLLTILDVLKTHADRAKRKKR